MASVAATKADRPSGLMARPRGADRVAIWRERLGLTVVSESIFGLNP